MSDAYSQRDGSRIRIGMGGIAMELELTGKGEFFLTSLVHKATGRDYVQPGPVRPDTPGEPPPRPSGKSPPFWHRRELPGRCIRRIPRAC